MEVVLVGGSHENFAFDAAVVDVEVDVDLVVVGIQG